MEEERTTCVCCGEVILNDYYASIGDDPVCDDCAENECSRCECCGDLIYDNDVCGQDYDRCLCESCMDELYVHCDECDDLIHRDDIHELDESYYCYQCYHEKMHVIRQYGYKPEPIFYGDSHRYFGVELEIDEAGRDNNYAEELIHIANMREEHIYIKSDGSLYDGMEIVSHPMTLEYHMNNFCWEDIMHHAVFLGYRSHQTSTCGLHIHVNRDSFSNSYEVQEEVISRILYFVEQHWNEMLKFSRRTEYNMNRWAARYGYENSPKAILDKAKKNCGRYVAVNLCNYHTIEFRLFRGTLKYNTLIATLELVNRICEVACLTTDEEIAKLSWSEFVAGITEPELIQYLKERNLYINEKVEETEEF